MTDTLTVRPVLRATGEIRRAASDCCGAKLRPGTGGSEYECRECGQACQRRVLPEPEEVTLHG